MDNAASIKNFISQLQTVRDKTLLAMLQFKLQVAIGLRSEIQNNIKNTFGADKIGRSVFTAAAMGNTARTSGRGGNLFNSVVIEGTPEGNLAVSVGGVGVPYANIHETGGDIYPKNSKYLTIPLNSNYANARAREFALVVGRDPIWGLVLKTKGGELAYALRRHVRMPKRPYVQPAIDSIQENAKVKLMLITAFQSVSTEVVV